MKSARPKVLHEVAGRAMLAQVLSGVVEAGADGVAVVVGPDRADVTAQALRLVPGAQVFEQRERLGTAHAALRAREALAAEGIPVAVVSLPCWELFAQQDAAYRDAVLGGAFRVGIEAAGDFGWERILGTDGVFIGMPGYGASAPAEVLYKHFGITSDAVVAAVRKHLA